MISNIHLIDRMKFFCISMKIKILLCLRSLAMINIATNSYINVLFHLFVHFLLIETKQDHSFSQKVMIQYIELGPTMKY